MIRILTDSASDILPAEAEQLGVTVIPLNVTLEDGTVLRDGIDKTPSEYYALLKECHKLPTTSQPSPETRCWASSCPMSCPAPGSAPDWPLTLSTWTTCCSWTAPTSAWAKGCWYGWLCSCAPPVRRWCRSPPTWSTPRSTCIWLPPSTT